MKYVLFLSFSLMTMAFDPTILIESEFNELRKFLIKDSARTKRDT